MWPFRKVPEITIGSFDRWLRAWMPQPITMFLELDELAQEQLAALGDDHKRDFCVAIGKAVANPAAAEAALGAVGDPDAAEASALQRITERAANNILRGVQAPPGAAPVEMPSSLAEGLNRGRAANGGPQAPFVQKAERPTLFGQAPDPIEAPGPPAAQPRCYPVDDGAPAGN